MYNDQGRMGVLLHGSLPFCHLTSNFAPEREHLLIRFCWFA